jgi:hypothetical protein
VRYYVPINPMACTTYKKTGEGYTGARKGSLRVKLS